MNYFLQSQRKAQASLTSESAQTRGSIECLTNENLDKFSSYVAKSLHEFLAVSSYASRLMYIQLFLSSSIYILSC